MCNLAIDAVACVAMEVDGRKEVDIKRYARVEKVPLFFFLFLLPSKETDWTDLYENKRSRAVRLTSRA